MIAGDDDLFSSLIEGIKDVKEFSLGALLSGNELDIVDKEDVHATKTVSKLVHPLVTDGIDELIGEVLRGEVTDRRGVGNDILVEDEVADSVEKVRLAEADSAVNEEGVVVLTGKFGNGETGGVGELVAWADDKVIKGVLWIERRPRGDRGNGDRGNGIILME